MLILMCSALQDIRILLHRFSGFPPCDGVGCTLNKLAACEQTLTPKQLFEFANSKITGVTTFFVRSNSLRKTFPFLESRF